MIDVHQTIYKTLVNKFNNLRFLAKDDSNGFRSLLSLIILQDLILWTDYLDKPVKNIETLREMITNCIISHPDFTVCYKTLFEPYINVNTPQNNYTWKRVWDSSQVKEFTKATPFVPESHSGPWTPDSTCPVSIVHYGGLLDDIQEDPETHLPIVDFNNLTTCDKMNLYMNTNTGQLLYLDPVTGQWNPVKTIKDAITWTDIQDRPGVFANIELHITDDDKISVSLEEVTQNEDGSWNFNPSQESSITMTDSNPDPDINTDLEDIL